MLRFVLGLLLGLVVGVALEYQYHVSAKCIATFQKVVDVWTPASPHQCPDCGSAKDVDFEYYSKLFNQIQAKNSEEVVRKLLENHLCEEAHHVIKPESVFPNMPRAAE